MSLRLFVKRFVSVRMDLMVFPTCVCMYVYYVYIAYIYIIYIAYISIYMYSVYGIYIAFTYIACARDPVWSRQLVEGLVKGLLLY